MKAKRSILKISILSLLGFLVLGIVIYKLLPEEAEVIEDLSLIPVTVVLSETIDLEKKIRVQGDIDTSTQPVIAAEVAAKVISMKVGEGYQIKKGQILAVLDSEPFEIAKEKALAEIQRIKALIANQERLVKRNRKLNKDKLLSQTALDDSETALSLSEADLIVIQARLKDTQFKLDHVEIISPFDGVVQTKLVSDGDYLKVGMGVYKIVNLKHIYARLFFPETLIGSIKTPTKVHLFHGEEAIEGLMENFRPMLEKGNRALHGLVVFKNTLNWKPGFSVIGEVTLVVHKDAVVVPIQAVVRRPSGLVVYLISNNTAKEIMVTTGLVEGNKIEILSGLEAGQKIALDGAPFLTDGVKISVKQRDSLENSSVKSASESEE